MSHSDDAAWKFFVIDLLPRVGPVLVAIAAFYFARYLGVSDAASSAAALSAATGFAAASWALSWKTERAVRSYARAIDAVTVNVGNLDAQLKRLHDMSIEILDTRDSLLATARSMYNPDAQLILATSINYRPRDTSISDSKDADWGRPLYSDEDSRVSYRRIVSVSSESDREWVRNMLSSTMNPNFDLRIVEGDAAAVLYPNVIITKLNGRTRALVSYRAVGGGGKFAFVTQSPEFLRGLVDHFLEFHASLPKAKECVARW